MPKKIILTENQLKTVIKTITEEKQQQIDEGLFQGIKDTVAGFKGVWSGYGFHYFKYMSRLSSLINKLKKLDAPNEKVMVELEKLKSSANSVTMPQRSKNALISLIDNALVHFRRYSSINDQILTKVAELKLGGTTPASTVSGTAPTSPGGGTAPTSP